MKRVYLFLMYVFLFWFLTTLPTNAEIKLSSIPLPPSAEARVMMFDHNGLMWIGTNSGLLTYDGYEIRTFISGAYAPHVSLSNGVLSLTEDHNGGIWIGTHCGLYRLDPLTGTMEYHKSENKYQQIIYQLFTASDGRVFVGTDAGFSIYNPVTQIFSDFTADNIHATEPDGIRTPRFQFSVKSFAEDKHGNIFIGTWASGVFRYSNHRFYHYPKIGPCNSAYALLFDRYERLWIGTWGYGIYRMNNPHNYRNPRLTHLSSGTTNYVKGNICHQLVEGVEGSVWVATEKGSIYYSSSKGKVVTIYPSVVQGIAKAHNGDIWAITSHEGLQRFTTRSSLFSLFSLFNKKDFLPQSKTLFNIDSQHLLVANDVKGFFVLNSITGTCTPASSLTTLAGSELTQGTLMLDILRKKNGELWMAMNEGGLLISKSDGSFTRLLSGQSPAITDNVTALCCAHDQTVWIGQRMGISFIQPDGTSQHLHALNNQPDLDRLIVSRIIEDHRSRIWVATSNNGILRIDGSATNVEQLHYTYYNISNNKTTVNNIVSCLEDSHHRLWAISLGGGLMCYNPQNDCFETVGEHFGILSDNIFSICEDQWGYLWMRTDNALVRLQINNDGTFTTSCFTPDDGIGQLSYSTNATCRMANRLYFGTVNGVLAFTPPRTIIEQHANHNCLIITQLYIEDIPITQLDSARARCICATRPMMAHSLTIPSSVRKFSIEFALLNYANQQQTRYAYQLEGYDREWKIADTRLRQAIYSNLPSGNYKFHVRATDSYGHTTELSVPLYICILPPWYFSWWAWFIYVVLICGGVWWSVRRYHRSLIIKNRLQMNNIFTNITHELLTPLTVISASVDNLRKETPGHECEYSVIQENISRLVRLLREILEIRKSQEKKLKLEVSKSDLNAFIDKMCKSILPMAQQRGITLNYLGESTGEILQWFDPDKMDKIVYNLLSNAIKYNRENGNITVKLQYTDSKAVLSVSDTGIGISQAKQKRLYQQFFDGEYRHVHTTGTGLGLTLVHDLVLLHHGNIHCDSIEGKGTTFTIMFPVVQKDYKGELYEDKNDEKTKDIKTVMELLVKSNDQPCVSDSKRIIRAKDLLPKDDEGETYRLLLVEDNMELLGLMERMLRRRYIVMTAHNGKTAINIIHREPVDLVVSDVMMPIMDGLELTRTIKGDKDYQQLPIILLTAKTCRDDRNEGFLSGADDYIAKPFRIDDLQLRIDNIIRNRERIRQRFMSEPVYEVKEQHYSDPDELLMKRAVNVVYQHLADCDFNRDMFATDMMMSTSTLYNKLRTLTGQNISGFISSIRLKEAYKILMTNPDIQIKELAYSVGFSTPKYFSQCFKKEFGKLPGEVRPTVATQEQSLDE